MLSTTSTAAKTRKKIQSSGLLSRRGVSLVNMSEPKRRSSGIQSGSVRTAGTAAHATAVLRCSGVPVPPIRLPAQQSRWEEIQRLTSPAKGPRTQAIPMIAIIGILSPASRVDARSSASPTPARQANNVTWNEGFSATIFRTVARGLVQMVRKGLRDICNDLRKPRQHGNWDLRVQFYPWCSHLFDENRGCWSGNGLPSRDITGRPKVGNPHQRVNNMRDNHESEFRMHSPLVIRRGSLAPAP